MRWIAVLTLPMLDAYGCCAMPSKSSLIPGTEYMLSMNWNTCGSFWVANPAVMISACRSREVIASAET
jgi:hypothetical protein